MVICGHFQLEFHKENRENCPCLDDLRMDFSCHGLDISSLPKQTGQAPNHMHVPVQGCYDRKFKTYSHVL
jgi:hypothetical protein